MINNFKFRIKKKQWLIENLQTQEREFTVLLQDFKIHSLVCDLKEENAKAKINKWIEDLTDIGVNEAVYQLISKGIGELNEQKEDREREKRRIIGQIGKIQENLKKHSDVALSIFQLNENP